MLNPDGSQRYQRHNAQGIDINRDALRLATPEGRLLKKLRSQYEPMLGFNLHDQGRRTMAGSTGRLATNSVLAVAGDEKGTLTEGRRRAMRACSAIAKALGPLNGGGVASSTRGLEPTCLWRQPDRVGTPIV